MKKIKALVLAGLLMTLSGYAVATSPDDVEAAILRAKAKAEAEKAKQRSGNTNQTSTSPGTYPTPAARIDQLNRENEQLQQQHQEEVAESNEVARTNPNHPIAAGNYHNVAARTGNNDAVTRNAQAIRTAADDPSVNRYNSGRGVPETVRSGPAGGRPGNGYVNHEGGTSGSDNIQPARSQGALTYDSRRTIPSGTGPSGTAGGRAGAPTNPYTPSRPGLQGVGGTRYNQPPGSTQQNRPATSAQRQGQLTTVNPSAPAQGGSSNGGSGTKKPVLTPLESSPQTPGTAPGQGQQTAMNPPAQSPAEQDTDRGIDINGPTANGGIPGMIQGEPGQGGPTNMPPAISKEDLNKQLTEGNRHAGSEDAKYGTNARNTTEFPANTEEIREAARKSADAARVANSADSRISINDTRLETVLSTAASAFDGSKPE